MPIKTCALMLAAAATMLHSGVGDAKPRRNNQAGIVTVCSEYGKGCVSGPIRQGQVEREVRLPGGSWIGCRLDCKQTLRDRATDWN